MRNATAAHYLDDDATASSYCHDCHEWNGEHAPRCPGDPNAPRARVITPRDVRRTLAGIAGVVPASTVLRHREEDR